MTDLPPKSCVAVVGPTGVGKTALAVLLASHLDLDVISVDSRQVYRFMDIGTAKPDARTRDLVRHHLIDMVDPDETYNAGRFAADALAAMAGVEAAGRLPLLVGGTGLYLKALTEGLVNAPAADPAIRAELREIAALRGREFLHRRLLEIDPEAARLINPRDLVRTMRALEIHRQTGRNFSALKDGARPRRFPVSVFGLHMPRELLYRRLDERVDRMMAEGLLAEVASLLERGYGADLPSMQGIGYRQLAAHLQGEISLDKAVEAVKKETRNLAKRQMTWFKAVPGIVWLDVAPSGEMDEVAGRLLEAMAPGFPASSRGRRP